MLEQLDLISNFKCVEHIESQNKWKAVESMKQL